MSKVLVGTEWYEALSSTALYETEFETILLQNTSSLFPGFRAAPFKIIVFSDTDSARPDYALVSTTLKTWWVIEVELGHHSLDQHVLPQIRTLTHASYGQNEAAVLAGRLRDVPAARITDLLKGQPPQVLVLVNQPRPEWKRPLEIAGAKLAVFEIFRSSLDRYIYRFNGFAPTERGQVVSTCRLDPNIPFLLRVDSPAALGLKRDERVVIEIDGNLTEWERLDATDTVWLHPRSHAGLHPRTEYELLRSEGGALRLQPVSGNRF